MHPLLGKSLQRYQLRLRLVSWQCDPVQVNLRTDGTGTAGNHRCGSWRQPAKVEMLKPTTHHTLRTEHSRLNHHLGLPSEHKRSEYTFNHDTLATARAEAVELTSEALPTVCQLLLLEGGASSSR
jgi:hypothetical protein